MTYRIEVHTPMNDGAIVNVLNFELQDRAQAEWLYKALVNHAEATKMPKPRLMTNEWKFIDG